MIRLAGLRQGIEIRITGIRPGERLHERLHDDAEVVEPAGHPSISALDPKATWEWNDLAKQLEGLRSAVRQRDELQVRGRLEDMLTPAASGCSLRRGREPAGLDHLSRPGRRPWGWTGARYHGCSPTP